MVVDSTHRIHVRNGQSRRTKLGVDLVVEWAYSGLLPLGIRKLGENGELSVELVTTLNAVLRKSRGTWGHRGQMIRTKLDSVFPRNFDSKILDLVSHLLDGSLSAEDEPRVALTELATMDIAMKVEESRMSISGFYIFSYFQCINACINPRFSA